MDPLSHLLVSIVTVCTMPMHEGPAQCEAHVEYLTKPYVMERCQEIAEKAAKNVMVDLLTKDSTRLPTLAKGICVFPADAPALLNQLPAFFESNGIKYTVKYY